MNIYWKNIIYSEDATKPYNKKELTWLWSRWCFVLLKNVKMPRTQDFAYFLKESNPSRPAYFMYVHTKICRTSFQRFWWFWSQNKIDLNETLRASSLLALFTVPRWSVVSKKDRGWKSRDTVPLKLLVRPMHAYYSWPIHVAYNTVPKEIDFPRYNMKCSRENVILRGSCSIMFSTTFHVISRKFLITFRTVSLTTPEYLMLQCESLCNHC